jgi:hypothetical protein
MKELRASMQEEYIQRLPEEDKGEAARGKETEGERELAQEREMKEQ